MVPISLLVVFAGVAGDNIESLAALQLINFDACSLIDFDATYKLTLENNQQPWDAECGLTPDRSLGQQFLVDVSDITKLEVQLDDLYGDLTPYHKLVCGPGMNQLNQLDDTGYFKFNKVVPQVVNNQKSCNITIRSAYSGLMSDQKNWCGFRAEGKNSCTSIAPGGDHRPGPGTCEIAPVKFVCGLEEGQTFTMKMLDSEWNTVIDPEPIIFKSPGYGYVGRPGSNPQLSHGFHSSHYEKATIFRVMTSFTAKKASCASRDLATMQNEEEDNNCDNWIEYDATDSACVNNYVWINCQKACCRHFQQSPQP